MTQRLSKGFAERLTRLASEAKKKAKELTQNLTRNLKESSALRSIREAVKSFSGPHGPGGRRDD